MQLLKIAYPVCCGIDVYKKFVVAYVASTNDRGITTYKTSRFSTYTNSLKQLSKWIHSNFCNEVCMESTSMYCQPVYNILETNCKITLAHPKYVKAIHGKKLIRKMPNGLLTYLNTILSPVILCHLLIFASCVT